MPKSISDQMNFEDLCHLQAFKGTDHLSRSVSQQLIPSLVERLNLWLNIKSAGKAGKLRAILRKANTPIELTASTILKTVFELEGQETSTIIRMMGCRRMSKRSDCNSWFLKSAEPAMTRPLTFGLSAVMKCCVVNSAILRT